MDGILNINKPQGKTSFGIVAVVRRLSGEHRAGHAGTLDPIATGVLPICLGQGTRITEFLVNTTKTYRTEIELGISTDTYDATGRITARRDPSGVSREQLEVTLALFCGPTWQTPPMYSAVKHQGKPLYQLARAGINIQRPSRRIRIYSLKLIQWQPPVATIEVECSKGTYIRSLAYDLGEALGCGASLKSLVRLRCGPFDIQDSVSMPQLEHAFRHGYWQNLVYPIDTVLSHWSAMVVDDDTGRAVKNGRPLILESNDSVPQASEENHSRVYTRDGRFLAVVRFDQERGQWQPEKVFVTDM